MNTVYKIVFLSICYGVFAGCNGDKVNFNPHDAEIIHQNEEKLTQTIIYDIFSPPVASRIYAYASLAQYEPVGFSDSKSVSFAAKLHGFPAIAQPEPGKE